MSLIPVDPNKEQQAAEEEQRQQKRAALVPMLVAMIAVGGAALYVFWEDLTRQPAAPSTPAVMIYTGGDEAMEDEMLHGEFKEHSLFYQPSLEEMVQVHPNDQSLDSEPADLSVPEHGQRLAGYRRTLGQHEQEIAVWLIKAARLPAMVAFYRQAAETQGFVPLPPPATGAVEGSAAPLESGRSTPPPITLRYWLPPEGADQQMVGAGFGQLLTIRLAPQAQDVRATLTLVKPVR